MERQRRRPHQRFQPDQTVPSPCIGACWLDEHSGLCNGCKRNAEEIRNWIIYSAEQKRAVLAQLAER